MLTDDGRRTTDGRRSTLTDGELKMEFSIKSEVYVGTDLINML